MRGESRPRHEYVLRRHVASRTILCVVRHARQTSTAMRKARQIAAHARLESSVAKGVRQDVAHALRACSVLVQVRQYVKRAILAHSQTSMEARLALCACQALIAHRVATLVRQLASHASLAPSRMPSE